MHLRQFIDDFSVDHPMVVRMVSIAMDGLTLDNSKLSLDVLLDWGDLYSLKQPLKSKLEIMMPL
jgi:hypothetical protein